MTHNTKVIALIDSDAPLEIDTECLCLLEFAGPPTLSPVARIIFEALDPLPAAELAEVEIYPGHDVDECYLVEARHQTFYVGAIIRSLAKLCEHAGVKPEAREELSKCHILADAVMTLHARCGVAVPEQLREALSVDTDTPGALLWAIRDDPQSNLCRVGYRSFSLQGFVKHEVEPETNMCQRELLDVDFFVCREGPARWRAENDFESRQCREAKQTVRYVADGLSALLEECVFDCRIIDREEHVVAMCGHGGGLIK